MSWNPFAALLLKSDSEAERGRMLKARRLALHHRRRAEALLDEYDEHMAMYRLYEERMDKSPMCSLEIETEPPQP